MTAGGTSAIVGPHKRLAGASSREKFCAELFDTLWERYRQRVSYVQKYEEVVAAAGATFFNDHIAFRTIGCERPAVGIHSLSRIFEALGYIAAGNYVFADKHLGATHFQHANPQFPKIFISELRLWELPRAGREILQRLLDSHREPISDESLATLFELDHTDVGHGDADAWERLMEVVVSHFQDLPWDCASQSDVSTMNKISQYGAWVMVHGYNVNHFTSLINSHGVESLNDIEKTIAALSKAGVPMKSEIEGERGSKLRQSATEAVNIPVEMIAEGKRAKLPWSYAYFELAQRDMVVDATTGKTVRFEGFLGPQATNLFEMTRVGAK